MNWLSIIPLYFYFILVQHHHSVSESEYRQLAGNLDEIIEVHNRLQISLEENDNTASSTSTRPHTPQNQSRIGRILLSHGAAVKSAHTTYWANHPKAVCIFEKYRDGLDKFMEGKRKNWPFLDIMKNSYQFQK